MQELLKTTQETSFIDTLTADPVSDNYVRRVKGVCYSFVEPLQPSDPELIHYSKDYLNELGFSVKNESHFLDVMCGRSPFNGFKSYAMCYGGHQFGHWAGQLGDGRAINIGEIEHNGHLAFQLKGSGPTPYSRSADGLAVLRSSIREYLCSEAMHHLGVPTTRALSLVKSGDLVPRDMFYNGNVQEEIGAIVCRVSPSFIRFGSFEIHAANQDHETLKKLVDYTITNYYSDLGEPSKEVYLKFFREVMLKTKEMIIHWLRVGFVHGVMNTDNMSILGLTIDYGPYGWLEDYNPHWTPNTTDAENRRYRFGNQAHIGLWNLAQLANALYPLIEEVEPLQAVLDEYKQGYHLDYHQMMCGKLGLLDAEEIDERLIADLTKLMADSSLDMTIFFRLLSDDVDDSDAFWQLIVQSTYLKEEESIGFKEQWIEWFIRYQGYVSKMDSNDRIERMKKMNPKYVLRNYMAQLAINEAEEGRYELVDELYRLLLTPYDEQPEFEKWFTKRPEWAMNKPGCSMLSCSS